MTQTEMLAYVRTYLDEASENFYLDDEEIYPALTLAQFEILNIVAKKWIEDSVNKNVQDVPLVIQPLVANTTSLLASGANSASVPLAFMLINVKWTPSAIAHTTYPKTQNCIRITPSQANRFLLNPLTKNGFYFWRKNQTVYVNPVSSITNAVLTYDYIANPTTDIDATHSAQLHEIGHQAICERALWLLLKDRETDQAQAHEMKADKLIGELI